MDLLNYNIKFLRKYYGYSSDEVAKCLGCTINLYDKIENGYHIPSIVEFEDIANLYGISLNLLINRKLTKAIVKTNTIGIVLKGNTLSSEDMEVLMSFNKLIHNYLKIRRLCDDYKTN
jgi:transcriptional regulator with XRE-family HTH domain